MTQATKAQPTQPPQSHATLGLGDIKLAPLSATATFAIPLEYVPIHQNALVRYTPRFGGGAIDVYHIEWDHSLRLVQGYFPPALGVGCTLFSPAFRDGWGMMGYSPGDNEVRLALPNQTAQAFAVGGPAGNNFTQVAYYLFGNNSVGDEFAVPYGPYFGKNTLLFYNDQTGYAEIHAVAPSDGSHAGQVVHGIPPGSRVLWLNLNAFTNDWPWLLVSDRQTTAIYALHEDSDGLRADRWIQADVDLGPQIFALSRIPLTGGDMFPLAESNPGELAAEQHLLSYDPETGLARIAVVRFYDAEIKCKVLGCLDTYWPSRLDISVYPSAANSCPGLIVRHSEAQKYFDIREYRPARQWWRMEDLNRIEGEAI